MLVTRGLTKGYGPILALDGVDLEVQAGEVTAILGPNGAGKSTLLSIVAGLRKPDAGQVAFDGHDLLKRSQRAKVSVGFAPQETGLYQLLTVRQNLEFFTELADLAGDRDQAIRDAAARTRLEHLLDRPASKLSGGERRRAHTAIALLGSPALLMLDEPTVGADIDAREALIAAVVDAAHRGSTVLYTTHYLPEVEDMNAKVVILANGRVVVQGTTPELIARYRLDAVEIELDEPDAEAVEVELAGRFAVTRRGGLIRVGGTSDVQMVLGFLESKGRIRNARSMRPTLQSIYPSIIGDAGAEPAVDETAVDGAP